MTGSYQREYSLRSSFPILRMVFTRLLIYIITDVLQIVNGVKLMNEKLLNEFAIYYKRIIRVERILKDLIIQKYSETYGDNAYNVIYKVYFSGIKRLASQNSFLDINRLKNRSNKEKLLSSVETMYISEVLSFFSHRIFLKDITRKKFFTQNIKTNTNEFRKLAKALKDFRNCICHFNCKDFSLQKQYYAEALIFFEKLLNCRYYYTKGAIASIEHKLSIKSILEIIHEHNPEYFSDDRILVNVFDDIALLAGYRLENLPQYKSIIRAKFKIEENEK